MPELADLKSASSNPVFLDVNKTDWFYDYVNSAYRESVVTGYEIGLYMPEFRPNTSITRAEALKIIFNIK